MHNQWTDSFVQESEELLAEIEECALSVLDGAPAEEAVARLFRAFHTIKGTGAMCGLTAVAGFTHHMESLLDDLREQRMTFVPEHQKLILAAVDHIRTLLAAELNETSEAATVDEELIQRIHRACAARADAPPAPASSNQAPRKPSQASQETEWTIFFRPDRGLFECGGNPLAILGELREMGEVQVVAHLDAVPALQQMQPTDCSLSWTITLKTSVDENAIRDVFLFVEEGAELHIAPSHGAQNADAEAQAEPQTAPAAERTPHTTKSTNSSAPAHTKTPAKESVVRVPSSRLDRLVNLVGELVMNQSRLALAAACSGSAEMANPVQEMERLVAELRDNVLGIRMLPIGSIYGRFQRLVHDLSHELGKEVILQTEGAETELDKSILDQLSEPLVHLVRNCVDHGIESAEERAKAGKPHHGTIRMIAEHRGSDVVIRVEDDGRGLDSRAIREKAIARKLISAESMLSARELVNLILLPGFSTAQQVTKISGRGVGMDAVKKQIESLRGSISIASEEGRGSSVSLVLPLTLAIIEGLIVQIGEDYFIIPMAAITENVELERSQRALSNGRNVLTVRGELVPYIDLRAAFAMEGDAPLLEKVVIVRHEEGRVGLVVDRVLGTHQTVLQSLGHFFRKIDVVSGATILGDGRVALIFDIPAVVRYVERQYTPC